MKISIVGTGYVGLVTGACLAEHGHDVTCVDLDRTKVDLINAARSPIHEDGLPGLLRRNAGTRLRATANLGLAVLDSEMTLIAVGTPAKDGRIDLRFVEQAAAEVGAALRAKSARHTVIVKSTVIPGTTVGAVRRCVAAASGLQAGTGFGLGMNPEFLTEGIAVADFMHPDRLVFGGVDDATLDALTQLYAWVAPHVPRIRTNPTTAEMIKYASNALLATLISYSNEIARLCSVLPDVDAHDVMHGVHEAAQFTIRTPGGSDARTHVAPITAFLEAGCGFGGSCLPKDVTALVGQGDALGLRMPLLRSVLEVNRDQPEQVLQLVRTQYPDLQDVPVTVLGLAFKPGTDDVRESPAFPIIHRLSASGARVSIFDPVARAPAGALPDGVPETSSMRDAVADAKVVVLVTRWPEFGELSRVLREQNHAPLVVDGRRMLEPAAFRRYAGIGRSFSAHRSR